MQDELNIKLEEKRHIFQEISEKLLSNEYTVNQWITELLEVIYSVSFDLCDFLRCIRLYKSNPNDENRTTFLNSRNS